MPTSLDDLIEAVQSAVIKAQQLAEDHHIDLVARFFEKDDTTGQMRAKTQEIWLPSMNPSDAPGTYVKVEVPLISLANLGSIRIKELTVEFDAKLGSLETADVDKDGTPDVLEPSGSVKPAADPKPKATPPKKPPKGFFGIGKPPTKQLSFDMKHTGTVDESTTARISITFEGKDPPEGVVRLNGAIIKLLP